MNANSLIGNPLDWAVAKATGYTPSLVDYGTVIPWRKKILVSVRERRGPYQPSVMWDHGGPLIYAMQISTEFSHEEDWHATIGCTPHDFLMWDQPYNSDAAYAEGPTPLIAAMRCFVIHRLGQEIDEMWGT